MLKVDIPNFSSDLDIKGFFDWLVEVDNFFEYTEFPEDKKVKFVAYKLKGRASTWWDRLRDMRIREGHGLVQTWHMMKQLLRGRFLPTYYEQYIFYAYKRCKHGNRRVNDYTIEFFKLT